MLIRLIFLFLALFVFACDKTEPEQEKHEQDKPEHVKPQNKPEQDKPQQNKPEQERPQENQPEREVPAEVQRVFDNADIQLLDKTKDELQALALPLIAEYQDIHRVAQARDSILNLDEKIAIAKALVPLLKIRILQKKYDEHPEAASSVLDEDRRRINTATEAIVTQADHDTMVQLMRQMRYYSTMISALSDTGLSRVNLKTLDAYNKLNTLSSKFKALVDDIKAEIYLYAFLRNITLPSSFRDL